MSDVPLQTALRRVIGLLRCWRERMKPRPELCVLDDHILKDLGLTREALRLEATWKFRYSGSIVPFSMSFSRAAGGTLTSHYESLPA